MTLMAIALATGFVICVVILCTTIARREIDSRQRRMEAWITIHSVLQLRRALPWPRPYSASPELLRILVEQLYARRPALVLELGSGVSTVVSAYALKRLGHGRIVSIEHEARFAEQTRALLREHGLDDVVEVIHAPLRSLERGGVRVPYYDLSAFEGLFEVDVLVVDGPPGKGARLARYPALHLLEPRLAPAALVIVDDARRRDERTMVARWMSEHRGWSREALATEKGTVLLHRTARPS